MSHQFSAKKDKPQNNNNPVEIILFKFSTNISLCWLDVKYQPRSFVYTRIGLSLMINAYGELLTSSRRLIFGGPHLR